MAWTLLASGESAEELQASAPDIDLPAGTKMRLEIITKIPVAPLADLWGAEWVIDRMLDQGEAEIVDVEGIGWNKIVVHMVARGAWVPIIIGVIVAICAYFGWQWFKEIRLFAEKIGPVAWAIIALIAAGMAIPLVKRLLEKKEAR
ncbi:MAG: hypothetical protein JRE40_02050 [Deltaproteobacteria bacterium]|nr:hypothetical protein [Deltaproteobacteria bacterium]MBW2672534.1 hypothetical protein [Deltaproteobacteria bacterium]